MGRFSNLEFDGKEKRKGPDEGSPAPGELRDENYYLRLADEQFRRSQFDKALRFYSRAVEYNPNLAAAWLGQVEMLTELGDYKEARLWADKALEIQRDHPDLLSAKGVAWARDGDAQKGIEFSDGALAKKGSSPTVWLARGETLLAGGRGNDEHCFERAASEAKQDWFTLIRIARVCLFHGQEARALAWAQKAMAREAASSLIWHTLGQCQEAAGLASQAEASYNRALSLDPEFSASRASIDRLEQRGVKTRIWHKVKSLFKGNSP